MTIDPRVGFWFSVVMAIVSALGICGTQLTTMFGDVMANKVLAAIVVLNVINGAINAILHAIPSKAGATNEFALGPKAVILLAVMVLGGLAFPGDVHAQGKIGQIQTDINNAKAKLDQLNQQIGAKTQAMVDNAKQAVVPNDSAAALPCMDISVLTKLTPKNLVSTFKGCEQDGIKQLVSDSSRALASAQAYVGPNGGAPGDSDGIACHKPALALFMAALNIPATPGNPAVDAADAVLNPDGSVKTPAISAVAAVLPTPEIIQGPILLYQKFGEFVMAGGLTSCPTWFNKPINAVGAAGVAGVGAIAGAALLAPK